MANKPNDLPPHTFSAHPSEDITRHFYPAGDYASRFHELLQNDFQVLDHEQYERIRRAKLPAADQHRSNLQAECEAQSRTIRQLKQQVNELQEEMDLVQNAHKKLQREHSALEIELEQMKVKLYDYLQDNHTIDGSRATEKARLEGVVAEAIGQKMDAVAKWEAEHEVVVKLTEQLEEHTRVSDKVKQELEDQRQLEEIWNTTQAELDRRHKDHARAQDKQHNESIRALTRNVEDLIAQANTMLRPVSPTSEVTEALHCDEQGQYSDRTELVEGRTPPVASPAQSHNTISDESSAKVASHQAASLTDVNHEAGRPPQR